MREEVGYRDDPASKKGGLNEGYQSMKFLDAFCRCSDIHAKGNFELTVYLYIHTKKTIIYWHLHCKFKHF